MSYANYGYGSGYGYGAGAGATASQDFVSAGGAYNPRYHFAAAQNAGFELVANDEGQPRTLYVGNLDPSVTEEFVCTLFSQIGIVTKTKVIFDTASDPYAFVEFADHTSAAQALQAMNHRSLLEREMKVNWATQPGTQQKVDTSKHFHVFVGDLSPEVDQKVLQDAFAPFGAISDVKVIRDPNTQKSKGYGFVSYPRREEAERAIEQMNGQWLGRRTIRTNWATRKPVDGEGGAPSGGSRAANGGGHHGYSNRPTFDELMTQTTRDNTSVYVGNVPASASEDDLRALFRRFGNIVDIRHFKVQGYSFVKFEQKEAACRAIIEMNHAEFMGQVLKCSWGKSSEGGSNRGGSNSEYFPSGFPGMPSAGHPAAASSTPAATDVASGGYDPAAAAQFYQYYQYYFQQQQAAAAAQAQGHAPQQ
uniref:Nucleolysin TIA-1/TIAR n=1 Tax=Panagrellus redivivus TaxID=6233 RepID=A0A7E4ZSI1_PANRE